jgi:hypothetical protein
VIRRQANGELEYGVLYAGWTVAHRAGCRTTVFLCNLFLLPRTEEEFLALPKEVFASAAEIAAAGWRVD